MCSCAGFITRAPVLLIASFVPHNVRAFGKFFVIPLALHASFRHQRRSKRAEKKIQSNAASGHKVLSPVKNLGAQNRTCESTDFSDAGKFAESKQH